MVLVGEVSGFQRGKSMVSVGEVNGFQRVKCMVSVGGVSSAATSQVLASWFQFLASWVKIRRIGNVRQVYCSVTVEAKLGHLACPCGCGVGRVRLACSCLLANISTGTPLSAGTCAHYPAPHQKTERANFQSPSLSACMARILQRENHT